MNHIALLVLMLTSALIGCTTSQLRVRSSPDSADVYLVANDGTAQKIGKTPLVIDGRQYPRLYSDLTQIRVVKDGYIAQSVLVPQLGYFAGDGYVSFDLTETELPKSCSEQEQAFNDLAKGIAEATNLIQKHQFADANLLLRNLVLKYNSVAVLYDLQGNVFYLQGDFVHALDAYNHANTLAPNNAQTLLMIHRLRDMQSSVEGSNDQ